ncbi:hypothetical protein TYRP_013287 [Tyrophagus putrescentiae]|nr:hypothetical protein TYRP_013287 [Tyrophagus putrescentiae]
MSNREEASCSKETVPVCIPFAPINFSLAFAVVAGGHWALSRLPSRQTGIISTTAGHEAFLWHPS